MHLMCAASAGPLSQSKSEPNSLLHCAILPCAEGLATLAAASMLTGRLIEARVARMPLLSFRYLHFYGALCPLDVVRCVQWRVCWFI